MFFVFVLFFHFSEEPSTPYCSMHGSVELGQPVTLTCHSENGSPTPTYNWTKLDAAKAIMPVMGRGEPSISL